MHPPPTLLFFLNPPPPHPSIKTDAPHGAHPQLKNEAPPSEKPIHPSKHEASFHKMIARKSTLNNNLKSS